MNIHYQAHLIANVQSYEKSNKKSNLLLLILSIHIVEINIFNYLILFQLFFKLKDINKMKKKEQSIRKKSVLINEKPNTPQQKLFKDLIDAWIVNDVEIDKINNYLKKLRERKILLESKLIPYIKRNQLDKSYIVIPKYDKDQKIYMTNETTYQNLSYKFITEALQSHIDQHMLDKICQLIKSKRSKTIDVILKRR